MEVSLIIPAHNEEGRLEPTLSLYGRALRARFDNKFEILVVANGCADDTCGVASAVAARFPQIKVLDIREPIGKGGAILKGFRYAQGSKVAFADADGATSAESLIDILARLDHHDVVIGSRRLSDSVIARRQPLARRAFGAIFASVVRVLFQMPYRDTQCGAKAFRRRSALSLSHLVEETRWAFDVDLLLSARMLGLGVAEYPVTWAHSPGSHLRVVRTIVEVILSLWRLKRRQARPAPARFLPPVQQNVGE